MILRRLDDRVLQLQRRLHHLVEHAVDAVADAEVLLVGLDVDVGGALLDGVEQDEVDELDDRRVVGGLREVVDVLVLRLLGELDVAVVEVADDLVERGALGRVVALDRLADGHLARRPRARRCSR